MCAILDANLVGEVFKADPSPAAAHFYEWMLTRRCRLVVGGTLRRELEQAEAFVEWALDAALDGRLQSANDAAVDTLAQELVDADACQSDDAHVIALARISGARLLFSNDTDLMGDFRNQHLLRPRGRLLPLGGTRNARQSRQRLFNEPDLCPEIRT